MNVHSKARDVLLVTLMTLVVSSSACYPSPDCSSDEIFCVGLVTSLDGINDQAQNQAAWEALQAAHAEADVIVNYIETVDTRDYSKNIAFFGERHYDVVVTVGSSLGDLTVDAAAMYPETDFIGVEQFQENPVDGVAGLIFPEEDAGFLAGALGAMMSTNHTIGAICGPEWLPSMQRYGEGFKTGAGYADEQTGTSTKAIVIYQEAGRQEFADAEQAINTAKSLTDQGVDVLFSCEGATGDTVLIAAAQSGAFVVGVDADQYYTLPEASARMLSSAMKLVTPGVADLIRLSMQGSFPSGNYAGDVSLAPFHDLEGDVPAEVRTLLEGIRKGLQEESLQRQIP